MIWLPQPPAISAILSNGQLNVSFDTRPETIPIDASNQDTAVRPRHGVDEHPELLIPPQRECLGVRLVRLDPTVSRVSHPPILSMVLQHPLDSPLLHPQPIIPRRRPKEQQHHHLQHNARDDAPVPMLHHLQVLLGGARGQRAADGLHQQTRDVERDKDEGIQVRADAGQGRAEGQADVLEGEVDGDADEGRGEDDGDDLGLERVLVPGVIGEGDARGVAWLSTESVSL